MANESTTYLIDTCPECTAFELTQEQSEELAQIAIDKKSIIAVPVSQQKSLQVFKEANGVTTIARIALELEDLRN